MARTTLRRDRAGREYELRCPREYEALITYYAHAYSVLVDFGSFPRPIKVVGADPVFPYSYLPTLDLTKMMIVNYDFLPDTTHLLPLEQPAKCAAMVQEFVGSITTTW